MQLCVAQDMYKSSYVSTTLWNSYKFDHPFFESMTYLGIPFLYRLPSVRSCRAKLALSSAVIMNLYDTVLSDRSSVSSSGTWFHKTHTCRCWFRWCSGSSSSLVVPHVWYTLNEYSSVRFRCFRSAPELMKMVFTGLNAMSSELGMVGSCFIPMRISSERSLNTWFLLGMFEMYCQAKSTPW